VFALRCSQKEIKGGGRKQGSPLTFDVSSRGQNLVFCPWLDESGGDTRLAPKAARRSAARQRLQYGGEIVRARKMGGGLFSCIDGGLKHFALKKIWGGVINALWVFRLVHESKIIAFPATGAGKPAGFVCGHGPCQIIPADALELAATPADKFKAIYDTNQI